MGIRTVWQMDLPDISGTHLHPADMTGRSSRSTPRGPTEAGAGEGRSGPRGPGRGAPGRLAGVTLAVARPRRDRRPLGCRPRASPSTNRAPDLLPGRLAGRVRAGRGTRLEGLSEIAVELPGGSAGRRRRGRARRRACSATPPRERPGGGRGRRPARRRRRLIEAACVAFDPLGAPGRVASAERSGPPAPVRACSTCSPRSRWRATSSRSSPTPASWTTWRCSGWRGSWR